MAIWYERASHFFVNVKPSSGFDEDRVDRNLSFLCIVVHRSLRRDSIQYEKCSHILFRNKRFMLDEMFQWNASKFSMILLYENTYSFYSVFIYFSPIKIKSNDQGWGYSLWGGGNKVAQKEKSTWVFVFDEYGNFWSFHWNISSSMYLEFLKCVAGEASGDAIYKMMAAKTGDGDKNRAKKYILMLLLWLKRD